MRSGLRMVTLVVFSTLVILGGAGVAFWADLHRPATLPTPEEYARHLPAGTPDRVRQLMIDGYVVDFRDARRRGEFSTGGVTVRTEWPDMIFLTGLAPEDRAAARGLLRAGRPVDTQDDAAPSNRRNRR